MTTRMGVWFAACMFVAFAMVLVAGPLVAPAPSRPQPAPAIVVVCPAGPHPPESTPDPLDPAWTPAGGRWDDPVTFYDEAARHPCMIGVLT